LGVGGLFIYTAFMHASFVLFALYRMYRRVAPAPEARAPYVAGGRPSPVAIDLDPRAPAPEEAADAPKAA
jgi:hypothetical protein